MVQDISMHLFGSAASPQMRQSGA